MTLDQKKKKRSHRMSKARVMRLVCACVCIYIYIGGNYRGIKNKIIIIIKKKTNIFCKQTHMGKKEKETITQVIFKNNNEN